MCAGEQEELTGAGGVCPLSKPKRCFCSPAAAIKGKSAHWLRGVSLSTHCSDAHVC